MYESPQWSPRRPVLMGLLTLVLGAGGFLAWSMLAEIDGAVIAEGRVEVAARHQIVQHPDGGIVAEIDVREGDTVRKGQPILRLDGTELKARETLLLHGLYEIRARIDRLKVEAVGGDTLIFRPKLRAAADADGEVSRSLAASRALFDARRETQRQTLARLEQRKAQAVASIGGYQQQMDALDRQLALIRKELGNQKTLLARGLTQAAHVLALQRSAADLEGQIGQLRASVAAMRSSIAGYEIDALRTTTQMRAQARSDLSQAEPRELELSEQLGLARTKIGRLVLRAPMAGRVLQMSVNTVGGVISAGQDVVSIVPGDLPLVFAVRVDPRKIERVVPGEAATVRFPNFDSRTTPTLAGVVREVSPDAITDPKTGATFYTARLTLTAQSAEVAKHLGVRPGMPLSAMIVTGARSPASFLIKPIKDYVDLAMRD